MKTRQQQTTGVRPGIAGGVVLEIDSNIAAPDPQPFSVGLPFPVGALPDAEALRLCDPDGLEIPVQVQPLARWGDRSIKWLLLDFVAPGLPHGTTRWTLRWPPGARLEPGHRARSGLETTFTPPDARPGPARSEPARSGPALEVRSTPDALVIDTGGTTFQVGTSSLQPLRQVTRLGAPLLGPLASRVGLSGERGPAGVPRIDTVQLETAGPVRATVRLNGVFEGPLPLRFVARLSFFAKTGLVRFDLTVHNPQRARHAGGLWDLGDPGSLYFKDLSLELELAGASAPRLSWRTAPDQPRETAPTADLEVYQDSSGGEQWQSPTHVNRFGRVPCRFRGYRLRTGTLQTAGLRASPVVHLERDGSCLSVAVPGFWEQFPKALEVEGGRVRVRLFPQQWADLFELQGGEQKTHTVWLSFDPAGPASNRVLEWVHEPARAHAHPAWYAETRALHFLTTGPSLDPRLEALLEPVVAGENNYFARREMIDEYGWRHYGEIYADHEGAYYKGPPPVISHYNNQYDFIYGLVINYLRTGDRRWFDLMAPLVRHVVDIDIYHTQQDKAAYNGGLFWHTDHYLSAATCTHRTFSRANAQGRRGYGGGPASQHNFTTGLLHFYYLTGDPDARDAVIGLADWVLAMDDGAKNILALLTDAPTGWASATFDFHGPGRGAAYSINALLDAWGLTGRTRYLEKAEALVRRCVHPRDDVAAHDLLNAELRWSYTMFFTVLARYLLLKAEAGQLDRMYARARSSLLHYAEWMLEHEYPYFDRVETLEFPTETWAGQEMRKANVLRLAACHAGEPLRSRLLARGQALADRAWDDLFRFESRTVARSIAIFMSEGPKDAWFRQVGAETMPAPAAAGDEGSPETFVPQRARVKELLTSGRGVARALVRLSDGRQWLRLLLQEASIKP